MTKFYQALAANQRLLDMEYSEGSKALARALATRKALEARLPSGSGFDNGTQILAVADNSIRFQTAFHHMNDNGYYTGWSHHVVALQPSFEFDFTIKVSGRNVNGIKDYIEEIFTNLMYEEFKP